MSVHDEIEMALRQNLSILHLEVENQSHLHAGHAGDDGSGESHFQINIFADEFNGANRVARERLVHKALGDIMNKVHALSVRIIEKH